MIKRLFALVAIAAFQACGPSPTIDAPEDALESASETSAAATDKRKTCSRTPLSLSASEVAPYALTAAGSDYVWTVSGGGLSQLRIWRRSTGRVETLLQSERQIGALAVRGNDIFFAELSYRNTSDTGQVRKVSMKSGKVKTLFVGSATDIVDDYSIAADAQGVYWVTHDPSSLSQHVWRLGTGFFKKPTRIAAVSLPFDQAISRLRVDHDMLYWATASGWAYRVAKTGGTPELVVDDVDGIAGWDVREGAFAYADLGRDGSVHLVDADGQTQVVAAQAHARYAVALTDDTVFYATSASLFKVARSGGDAAQFVSDAPSVASFVVDGGELGWAETLPDGGRVRTMCLANAQHPEPQVECPIEFAASHLCASLTWTSGPKQQSTNAYVLRFWKKGQPPTGPSVDAAAKIDVKLWMPAHGHGSTVPTITRVTTGEYKVESVNFTMGGDWQLQHTLKDTSGATIDKANASITIP